MSLPDRDMTALEIISGVTRRPTRPVGHRADLNPAAKGQQA